MTVENLYWTKFEKKKDKTNGKQAKQVVKSYLLAMLPAPLIHLLSWRGCVQPCVHQTSPFPWPSGKFLFPKEKHVVLEPLPLDPHLNEGDSWSGWTTAWSGRETPWCPSRGPGAAAGRGALSILALEGASRLWRTLTAILAFLPLSSMK